MEKTYTVKFYTFSFNEDGDPDDKLLTSMSSNQYIPIPTVGDTISFENSFPVLYEVATIHHHYNYSEAEDTALFEAEITLEEV